MSTPTEAPYCRIEVPGKEVTIRLRFSLMERLAAEIEDVLGATGRESGGILLGSVSGQTVMVEDYDPIPSGHMSNSRFYLHPDLDRERMTSAVALWRPNGEDRLRVIGFYRCNDRPALVTGDEERQLFAQELNGETSVLVLIQPGRNGRTGLACYLAERGRTDGTEGRIEIELKKPEAVVSERPVSGTKAPHRDAKHQTTENSSSGLARIAAVPLAAGMLWLGFLQYQILKGMNAEASSAPPAPLGLEMQPQGHYWRVTWNRTSAYLDGAARGHLRIEDGGMSKDIDLNPTELRTSSIIYDSAGNEISVHLEVFGAGGDRSTAESLRLLAALPPAQVTEASDRSKVTRTGGFQASGSVREFQQPGRSSLPVLPLREEHAPAASLEPAAPSVQILENHR
jgi:hypothetical protein